MGLEELTRIIVRWSPTRLTADDIVSIIREHGYDNDSLEGERSNANAVEWEIAIKVRRVGGDDIWQ